MKNSFFIAFLILLPSLLFSQSGPDSTTCPAYYTLTGIVTDSDTREALIFASVYIRELRRGAVTDEKGRYTIANICPGTYTAVCTHIGCQPLEAQILIHDNTTKDFDLPHKAMSLDVLVVADKKTEQKSTQSKSEITGRELEKSRGLPLGEALKSVPGVSTLQTGASVSKPVIHGMHSNRVLVLNNGVRQEGQQWGAEHAPEVDPFIAGRLSVVKGAGSVRYGSDAIAGVVLVEPRPLRDSAGIGGELNLVGYSNGRQGVVSGILEGKPSRLSPLSWRVQGTLKKGGNIRAPRYYLRNTGSEELNFSLATGYTRDNYGAELFYSQFNTTLGIFSGSHIGNLTDLQNAFNRPEPADKAGFSYDIARPYQHIEHELLKARFFYRNRAGRLVFQYARQYNLRYEYDRHRPLNDSLAGLDRPDLNLEITTHTGELLFEHAPLGTFTGSLGVSGVVQGNTYTGRYFIPNFRNQAGGVFAVERWRAGDLTLEAGLRYDYRQMEVFRFESGQLVSPLYRFRNVSGSIGGIYSFSREISLNFDMGTAWRPPAINELFSDGLHHGAASVERGNRNLNAEKAYTAAASLKKEGSRKLNAELGVYYSYIGNFIYLSPELPPTLTIKGAFPTFVYRQVDARFHGADLSAGYLLSRRLTLSGKASVVRAFNLTEGEFLIFMPSDRASAELRYDFPGNKAVRNGYLSVSLGGVSRQHRAPAGDYVSPPAGYLLAGIDAGATFFPGGQEIEAEIEITNLFNTSYRDYLDRFRYYTDAMGRNIKLRLKIPLEWKRKKR
jgi:iron complex outermembrane recepter protein